MPRNSVKIAARTLGEVFEVPRYIGEAAITSLAFERLLEVSPKGDGHGVIVFPGFLGTDYYNRPLLRFLRNLGYDATGWGQGLNLGPRDESSMGMLVQLNRLHRRTGTKVSLVGHSLGGMYARELAKLFPDRVRSVITLGSPIAAETGHGENAASRLFKKLNAQTAAELNSQSHHVAPEVPTTSIYSKTDAIVHWRKSIQMEGHDRCENIGVIGSHCGMTANAAILYLLADRLSQSEAEWQEFSSPKCGKMIYSA